MLTVRNGKSQLLNDMCPDMCRIAYIVRVSVLRRDGEKSQRKALASSGKKVRIIPAVDEEPPINVPDHEDDGYCTRKEKDVRRGWTRAKRGRIVVAAAQPKSIELLPESNKNEIESVNSVATLHLRFDPAHEHEQPPSLGTVGTKLTTSTFFSANPWTDFPGTARAGSWAQLGRGIYIESVPLSTRCVASAQWTKHSSRDEDSIRRDSLNSTSSSESLPGPSASFDTTKTPHYYTTSVIVPITLPENKAPVPTFHSCLISRVYSLDLSVSYHPANTSFLGPAMSLKLPIQVSSASRFGNKDDGLGMVISPAEVEAEFFTPRSVSGADIAARPGLREAVPPPPPAYADYQPRVANGGVGLESRARTVVA